MGRDGAVPTVPAFFNLHSKELHMNWDQIQGNWKQAVGKVKEQWGQLTDDDLDVVGGRREQLAGKIQERYGIAKDDAEKQLAEWQRKASDAWFPKTKD
jgi:uncharacterized protein YjbJ (UPF0337 family)